MGWTRGRGVWRLFVPRHLLVAALGILPMPASSAEAPRAPHPVGASAADSIEVVSADVHATLRTWADDTWLKILDRDGARDGRLSRRGILQRFNRTTDDEYWLDLISKGFSLHDDYWWHRRSRGLRFAATSVTPRDLAETMDVKVRVPLGSRWDFDAAFTEAKGPDLDRDLFRVGFARKLGRGAFGRIAGTLGSVKPSADFELGGGFRSEDGRTEILVAAGVLDMFNDIIYLDLGVHPNHADTALAYERQPLSLRMTADVAIGAHLRVEGYGATVRTARVRAFAQLSPLEGFRQREAFAFAGGLVEWAFSPDVATGVFSSVVDSEIERTPLPRGTLENDMSLDEWEARIGAFGLVRPHDVLRLECWIAREWREELRVANPDAELTSVDYADRTWTGTIKGIYGGRSGFQAVAAVDFDLRHNIRGEGEVPTTFDTLGNHNVRFRLDFGWRLAGRGRLVLGAGLDLDGDEHSDPRLFDGGRARFEIRF